MVTTIATRTIMISEIFGPTIQGEGALLGKPTVFIRTGGCDYRCTRCDTLYAVLPEHRAEWQPMSSESILAEVRRLAQDVPVLITLSGGNPAMQPFGELITMGHEAGYTFALETQGSIAKPWFSQLDYLTLSPKGPGMIGAGHTNWERLDRCISYARSGEPINRVTEDAWEGDPVASEELSKHDATVASSVAATERRSRLHLDDRLSPQICLKIVVFDEEDYAYARYAASRYPDIPIFLQAGNHTPPHLAQELDIPGILQRMDWLIQRVISDHWYEATVLPQLHTLLWGNKRGV